MQVQQLAEQEAALDDRGARACGAGGASASRQRLGGGSKPAACSRCSRPLCRTMSINTRVRGEAYALRKSEPAGRQRLSRAMSPVRCFQHCWLLLLGRAGSLLYLFPAYLNRPVPVTMAEIVVRLIFGMVAALAFYVLANAAIAGLLHRIVRAAGTTSATLNPFTVSLVAFRGGRDGRSDIAKWIPARGRGMFQHGGAGAYVPPQAAEPAPAAVSLNNEAIS